MKIALSGRAEPFANVAFQFFPCLPRASAGKRIPPTFLATSFPPRTYFLRGGLESLLDLPSPASKEAGPSFFASEGTSRLAV